MEKSFRKVDMKRRSKSQIQNLLTEWRKSGQSQSKFCQSKSLAISTFQSWIRKEGSSPVAVTPSFSFVEVVDEAQASYSQMRTLRIKTAYGLILEIPL
jgi:hypothetical protein